MVRSIIGGFVVAAFLLVTGCNVDCEICCSSGGYTACSTAKNVKKKSCEDCSEASSASCTCTVQ
jgi:hypothetical protein